jgi:hypothetical protein
MKLFQSLEVLTAVKDVDCGLVGCDACGLASDINVSEEQAEHRILGRRKS